MVVRPVLPASGLWVSGLPKSGLTAGRLVAPILEAPTVSTMNSQSTPQSQSAPADASGPVTDPTERESVVMATGHRLIRHPDLVRSRAVEVLRQLGPSWAVSGGAEGADTLFAEAALATGTNLWLMLPNRHYRANYPSSVPDSVVAAAARVSYVVDRPEVPDWRQRWTSERWWVDNFARNRAMLAASGVCCLISDRRPAELLAEQKGGTAACLREAVKAGFSRALWIPDLPDRATRWVTLPTA